MLVKEAMKRAFVIDKDVSLQEAARIMSAKNIGSLIFVSGKKVKGILTERDIVKNFDPKKKVSNIMSKSVITVGSEDTLDEALRVMTKNKIKRLPVVDSDELVGIITATDLLSYAEEIEGDFFFN